MKFKVAIYFPRFFLLWSSIFQFHPFLKNKKQLGFNWAQKDAMKGKKFENQNKNLEKENCSNPK
jgi:hypothetical protein